jgi:hypothetical protein
VFIPMRRGQGVLCCHAVHTDRKELAEGALIQTCLSSLEHAMLGTVRGEPSGPEVKGTDVQHLLFENWIAASAV